MKLLTVQELAEWLKSSPSDHPVILDVRENWELATASLPSVLHIPMGEVPDRLGDIPRDRPVVCLCHHGMRSYQVGLYLLNQGYEPVYNLTGGIHAWSTHIDPQCPVY